jgi:predicted nucleotidyltransferase
MTRTERILAAITATVVQDCDPDLVMLFGSWAKRTADVYSDVDLLVVGEFRRSHWLRDAELRDDLRRFPLRFDLHLLTPAELQAGMAKQYSYLDTIRGSSRCLYSRPGGPDPAEYGFRTSCGPASADVI